MSQYILYLPFVNLMTIDVRQVCFEVNIETNIHSARPDPRYPLPKRLPELRHIVLTVTKANSKVQEWFIY
ncbi:hypothetical protein W02_35720 [Nitrospira sp. KM1]|nr:hypothetical protein W02_35720 [Nitrospira sp. KM1]